MKNLIFLLLLLICPAIRADIAVIANIDSGISTMTKQEVEEVFMGRTRILANGDVVLPLDQSELRSDFYLKLTNRPIAQINSYWSIILFSGQASKPMQLSDDETVIKTVSKNKGAIGYVNAKNADKKLVRILLDLN
jgi:ABC-type phosphate transport system substrate-binding protein